MGTALGGVQGSLRAGLTPLGLPSPASGSGLPLNYRPGFLCTDGAGAWLGGEGGMPIVKKWEIKLSGRP